MDQHGKFSPFCNKTFPCTFKTFWVVSNIQAHLKDHVNAINRQQAQEQQAKTTQETSISTSAHKGAHANTKANTQGQAQAKQQESKQATIQASASKPANQQYDHEIDLNQQNIPRNIQPSHHPVILNPIIVNRMTNNAIISEVNNILNAK